MSAIYNYELSISFESIKLGCCGFVTLLPEHFINARRDDHKIFYCPNCGGSRYYPQKSKEEILEAQLAAERRGKELALAQAEHARNQARAQKAAKTRVKNRISNGVCPCCNRYFKDLHRHIQNKHPDYTKKEK